LSKAIAASLKGPILVTPFEDIRENPGQGIEARYAGNLWRLGRRSWAVGRQPSSGEDATALSRDGKLLAAFRFADVIRPEAGAALAMIMQEGFAVEMLSGDARAACYPVAQTLGIDRYSAGLMPSEKVARIAELGAEGRKVFMVGDGLNDAPALSAAHVSMAPATAADIGRSAADFVFLRESLSAVPLAIDVARRAARLIRENLALAVVYNAIAVPIAILGYVTPLIAAIAMSSSSLLVIANALRLLGKKKDAPHRQAAAVRPTSLQLTAAGAP
jgi:Cu2+-exporting ATPase